MESKCKKTPDMSFSLQTSILNQSEDSLVLHSLNSTPVEMSMTPDCGGMPPTIAFNRAAPRRQRTNAVRQSGTNLTHRLEFDDSDGLETMRQDFINYSNRFHTPTAIDEVEDEDNIDVVSNVGFLRRSWIVLSSDCKQYLLTWFQ